MSEPLVSIICVSMNHEKYIEQGIQSLINQTYKNLEILYVDNFSADASFETALAFLEKSSRAFVAHKREQSYNLPQNFNFLIEKAKGKYLDFISADDWVKPTFIEEMVREYEKNPDCGLLYTNGWYYFEDKNVYELAENKKFISGTIFEHVFLNGVLFPVGIMVKREVFNEIGFYDESIIVEDYDLWLRIAEKYSIGYSKQPLVYYRRHSKSMTSTGFNKIEYYIKIAEKYKTHRLFERVCRNFRQFTMYRYFLDGNISAATKMFIKDFRFERFYLSVAFNFYILAPFKKLFKY